MKKYTYNVTPPKHILYRVDRENNTISINSSSCRNRRGREESVVEMLDNLDETQPMYFIYTPGKKVYEELIIDPRSGEYSCTRSPFLGKMLAFIEYLYDTRFEKNDDLQLKIIREGLHG